MERRHAKYWIPADQHVKLHQLRVLTGRTVSSIVEDALESYLEGVDILPAHLDEIST